MTEVRPHASASTVLISADGQASASLRTRSTPRAERYALGQGMRQQVPRSSLSQWTASADRRNVLDLLAESHDGRIDWLVPVRVGRMVASPYGFLRGAAVVMAEDFARLPATGITPVICGDAHVGNIGFYGSPERELVLDLNDFDEASAWTSTGCRARPPTRRCAKRWIGPRRRHGPGRATGHCPASPSSTRDAGASSRSHR